MWTQACRGRQRHPTNASKATVHSNLTAESAFLTRPVAQSDARSIVLHCFRTGSTSALTLGNYSDHSLAGQYHSSISLRSSRFFLPPLPSTSARLPIPTNRTSRQNDTLPPKQRWHEIDQKDIPCNRHQRYRSDRPDCKHFKRTA